MVSHDGGDFLPRTLAALAAQTRPADAVIGVDTGSRDHSAALLEQELGKANVTVFDQPRSGMGGAVMAGLKALSPWPADGAGAAPGAEWIWLLHDDAAPAPEALAELLHAVERAPSVTVAGCKQLDWHAERRLIDVGLSTSRWAERLTLIDADELDQGQYDGRSDTFAVNSAGMLVRRDIWEELRGFDPALPGSGDDVDFCWRNRLAGHRVVVVPSAKMFHVSHRPHALGNATAARKAQVHLRLKHAAGWKVPLHAVGALVGSLFKLVLSIAVKDPGHGFSQLLATFAGLGRPAAVIRGRRNAARTRRIRRSVMKGLQTPRREVWAHRRSLIEALGADDFGDGLTGTDPLAEQPTGDADDFAAIATPDRGWVGNGAVLAILLTLAVSLTGLLSLFRAPAVSGGALIPVSLRLSEIWSHASTWWISLGAGLPGHGDPFGYLLWVLGVLGAGDANGAVGWLLILAMPLSALGAWFAAGALTPAQEAAPGGRPGLGRGTGAPGRPQPGPAGCLDCARHDPGARPGTAPGDRHGGRPRRPRRPGARPRTAHPRARRPSRRQRDAVLDGCGRRGPRHGRGHRRGAVAAGALHSRRCPLRRASGPPRPHGVVGAPAQPGTVPAVRLLGP